ncbi:Sulfur carrier protein ThiS [Bathymodiolus thermophilus thioautotrophic gill symbiont]|jgi:sulfur carrier protein|uniref:Sulfur carrier protein ThiS n=1 Tax=Bathymodiolus thermophilus thioautotrophic gill symbiont TaxID=2360 RepID=A0A1J5UJD1_9GAMM|nr:sulfur carrier protein ThiS [Bathymodiolus thermophilus thioautotrophic gill symbiont]AYQ57432.1 Sulfur carrier protein ThiS [Bathymodiolus thermophilus thioautotrophic gill symbiont]OIR24367.1 thiamine biosynthesis protein ThiS [Bathymodiolus thermophilus thioautotrophic gill symbiont]CAB5495329.1 Sulfur carrier protein ThiS [Bathymodiolus thermophilus thioautotrophic gill symbiont]CAB5504028.1 Sulfur carrier protein ThiS [Bathymodiolus thermophilus thioautotrophic gill symbiont]SGZ81493.1
MILQVNGEQFKIASGSTATDLIAKLNYQNQRIALEVNEAIIPKSNHTEFLLNEGDKIEIIKAVGGG